MSSNSFPLLTFDQLVDLMATEFVNAEDDTERAITADDVAPGSVALSLFEAVAAPLEELETQIGIFLPAKYYFGDAVGVDLDGVIESLTLGLVVRANAGTGSGPVVINGQGGAVIPSGTAFTTADGVQIATTAAAAILADTTSIGSTAAALATGPAGDLLTGTVLTPVNALAGVTNLTIPDDWIGGQDIQSDDAFKATAIAFLNGLAKGNDDAIKYGAAINGYDRCFISKPGAGLVVCYLDDGNPVNNTKIEAARLAISREWAASGATVQGKPPLPYPVAHIASLFVLDGFDESTVQAAVIGAWQALYATKREGDGLDRLELIDAATSVPGYNGISLASPAADLTIKPVLDEYNSRFGAGDMYPYQVPTYGGATFS